MYSNLYESGSPFADMYVDVTENSPPPEEAKQTGILSSIFSKFGDNNLITLLILAFLLFDAEDDERLIILALAIFMGI